MARKLSIVFGLVNIPIKTSPAIKEDKISFHYVSPAGNRVRQKLVDEVTGQEVTRDNLLRGYELSKDQLLLFKPEELESLKLKSTKAVEIVGFTQGEVDPLLFKEVHYISPEKGGEKGYSILLAVLDELKQNAVGKVVMNGKEYVVLVQPWRGLLRMVVLYYPYEASPPPSVTTAPISEKEKELGKMLLQSLGIPKLEELKDRYREAMKAAIEAKARGEKVELQEDLKPTKEDDVADLLAKALEAAKKKKLEAAAAASSS